MGVEVGLDVGPFDKLEQETRTPSTDVDSEHEKQLALALHE